MRRGKVFRLARAVLYRLPEGQQTGELSLGPNFGLSGAAFWYRPPAGRIKDGRYGFIFGQETEHNYEHLRGQKRLAKFGCAVGVCCIWALRPTWGPNGFSSRWMPNRRLFFFGLNILEVV